MGGKTDARIKAVIVPPVIAQVRVEGTTVHRAPAYASRRVVHCGDCFNEPVIIKGAPEKGSSQPGMRSRAYRLFERGRSSMTALNSGQRCRITSGYWGGVGFQRA
jgi:hypothetical protein